MERRIPFSTDESKEQSQNHCGFNFQTRMQGGGGSVSMWGCFTTSGPGPLVFYDGRLNASRYINVISNTLLPFIAANFDMRVDEYGIINKTMHNVIEQTSPLNGFRTT